MDRCIFIFVGFVLAAPLVLATAPQAQQRVPINECIDARITQGPQITSSERYWEWEYEFTNNCNRDLEVYWHGRFTSQKGDGWDSGSLSTVRAGATERSRGLWSRRQARQRGYVDHPPAPLVVWCVAKAFADGQCGGRNAYRRSPANWNPLGRY